MRYRRAIALKPSASQKRATKSFVLAGLMAGLVGIAPAVRLLEATPVMAQTVEQRKAEADRLLQQGIQQFEISQVTAALQSWQQAAGLYGDREREAEADELLAEGVRKYKSENFEAALQAWTKALKLYRELNDRKGETEAIKSIESLITPLKQNLNLYRKESNLEKEVKAIGNIVDAYFELRRFREAEKFIQASIAEFRKPQRGIKSEQLVKVLYDYANRFEAQGWNFLSRQDWSNALEPFQSASTFYRQIGNQYGESSALTGITIVYDILGQHEKAMEHSKIGINLAKKSGNHFAEGRLLLSLGEIHYFHLKQPEKALIYFQQALPFFQSRMNQSLESYALSLIGLSLADLGDSKKALESLNKALGLVRQTQNKFFESFTLTALGKFYLDRKDFKDAISALQEALSLSQESKNRWVERETLSMIGDALKQQNQPELAIVFHKQSVNITETFREQLRSLPRESQESYTQTVIGTYRSLADLLLAQGRVLEAQQVLELLKIQELRDYTRDTRTGGTTQGSPLNPLEKPIPAAYNDKIDLGNQLTQCEQQKCPQRSQLITQRDAANTKFTALVDRLKKLLREQEIKDPAQLQSDRFTLAAQKVILANPATKTVLVYPLVLDDKLWLVWGSQAGKSGIVFDSKEVPVSRKDLSAKVGELQTLLSQRGDPKQLQQISQQLYQWLIAPIRPQLDKNGVKQIVFSLDRATRYIPMAALHDGNQYLVENFAISTILTAEIDTQDKLAANLQDNAVLGLGLTQAVSGFAALPAVQTEIDGIIRNSERPQDAIGIYPGLKLFDRDFTETALREKVADYRILHIATHGQFISGNPEDSFLIMGDGSKLSIPTIQSMTALANTHLVVLSACETGKGGVDKEGLEVAGIGHYFLLSGAKSVMASLWLVNDPATSLLMQRFYQNLSQGNISKAEALRQVQIAFIQGKLTVKDTTDRAGARRAIEGQLPVDSLAHPFYWAPFILIGNSL